MSKKQLYQTILLPTIFVFLIAAMVSTGNAAFNYDASYYDEPSIDASLYLEVKPDGTIPELDLVTKISNINPAFKNDVAELVSYYMASDEFGDDEYLALEDIVANGNDVMVRLKNKKPLIISESPLMSFTSYDGKITFKDKEFISTLLDGSFTYTLKMPGKIVDSNANQVKGDTAVWFFRTDARTTEVWATSKVPGFPFGLVAIVLVICAAVGVFLWRRL
jgi:hypothetical protein